MATSNPPTALPLQGEANDNALMSAYAAGNAAAFEQLYARQRAGLYRFVRRVLGSALAVQTDEVFQDTWLRVVQARASWSPQGASFKTWLFTLAHHRAIDLLRRSGRQVSIDAFDNPDTPPWEPDTAGSAWQHWPAPASGAPHSDELAFWRRAGGQLLDCLDQLPLPQRSAFCCTTTTAWRSMRWPAHWKSASRPRGRGCATR